MKIALIKPPYPYASFYKVPLGLAYLRSLSLKEHDCRIFDGYNYDLSEDELVNAVVDYRPDVIGITANTPEVPTAGRMASKLKENLKSTIILGGPHITALPEETFQEFRMFDFGIYGEGERPFSELLNRLGKPEVLTTSNLVFRNKGEIQVTSPSPPLDSDALDSLPLPDLSMYYDHPSSRHRRKKNFDDLGSWRSKGYTILTSRGCPCRCIFCMRVLGNRVRRRSTEGVLQEIEYAIREYNVDTFFFADEIFLNDSPETNLLLEQMIRKGIAGKIRWSAMTRANLVKPGLIELAKKAGCVSLHVGVESGDDDVLKRIGKGITVEQAKKAINIIKKHDISSTSFFILGHPGETVDTLKRTVRLARDLNTDTVAFGIMVPYPGTQVYRMAVEGEGGYRLKSKDWSLYDKYGGDVLKLDNVSQKQIERYQRKAYLSFYLRNLRFKDLFKLIYDYRQTAWHLLNKWFIR